MRKTALALLASTVLVAGCGGGKSATNKDGAKVFASSGCGGCHTLSAAKSSGQTGPNLDQLKPTYDAVVRQVSNGGGGMPSFSGKLNTAQIRDVASFGTRLIETEVSGALNVVAPEGATTFGGLLQACRDATGSDAEFVCVPDQELLRKGVRQWSELPLWRTMPGVWQVDATRARDHGLLCRPIHDTAEGTWQWMQHLGGGVEANDRSAEIGLGPDREQEILAVVD